MSSDRPFQIQHIDHIVLRAKDLPRGVASSRDVPGCTVARERPSLGMVHLHAGTSMIDLVAVDGKLGTPGGAAAGTQGRNLEHLCLRVEPFDVERLRAHLQMHAVELRGKPESNYGAEGDGLSVYLLDPDGNGVELKGPASDCGCS